MDIGGRGGGEEGKLRQLEGDMVAPFDPCDALNFGAKRLPSMWAGNPPRPMAGLGLGHQQLHTVGNHDHRQNFLRRVRLQGVDGRSEKGRG